MSINGPIQILVHKSKEEWTESRLLFTFVTHKVQEHSEAATGGVLLEKVFLQISQNSQENTCARVSFLINL